MQEYLVHFDSRVIDLDNYILPKSFPYRPLQDEYVMVEEKGSSGEKKLFKICKIVHGVENATSVLTLFLSR